MQVYILNLNLEMLTTCSGLWTYWKKYLTLIFSAWTAQK